MVLKDKHETAVRKEHIVSVQLHPEGIVLTTVNGTMGLMYEDEGRMHLDYTDLLEVLSD